MNPEKIQAVLDSHEKWARGEEGGASADLASANLAGANLARANLAGANLDGAYLDGANLAGAYLARAYLARANLARANLAGANLAGAYLARANLAGANLAGANLDGANLDVGKKLVVASWLHSGAVLSHSWIAFRMADGSVLLRYGCEQHDIGEWPGLLSGLCERHEPDRADEYEHALSALIEFVAACARYGRSR